MGKKFFKFFILTKNRVLILAAGLKDEQNVYCRRMTSSGKFNDEMRKILWKRRSVVPNRGEGQAWNAGSLMILTIKDPKGDARTKGGQQERGETPPENDKIRSF